MPAPPKAEPPKFIRTQYEFAAHIRDPQRQARPADVDDRRMAVYRELFYSNLEGFLADNFPVVKRVLPARQWHAMARDFLARHRCRTPYFPEIGQEFLSYLQEERDAAAGDPPFLLELAHYEWVELALAFSDADRDAPAADPNGDVFTGVPVISPLAWNLSYHYPVHRIGPEFQPRQPGAEPTHLIVYRNRLDRVQFLEINGVTQRLLQLLKEHPAWTGGDAVARIAEELQHPRPEAVTAAGRQLLGDLRGRDILLGTRP
jgi:hypothetical protein